VLVDVVAVLVVPVAVVQMILVVTMLDDLAAVAGSVNALVGEMEPLLWVALISMHMVGVVAMLDHLAAVSGQVLMVGGFGMPGRHAAPPGRAGCGHVQTPRAVNRGQGSPHEPHGVLVAHPSKRRPETCGQRATPTSQAHEHAAIRAMTIIGRILAIRVAAVLRSSRAASEP
jgi:hypothetical protein